MEKVHSENELALQTLALQTLALQTGANTPDTLHETKRELSYLLTRKPRPLVLRMTDRVEQERESPRTPPQPDKPPVSSFLTRDDFYFTF